MVKYTNNCTKEDDIIDLLQEYKELYYKEIEHSERLNNKIGTTITFLTILGSAQVLLWTQFKTFEFAIYSIIYLILCIISLCSFVVSAYHFFKSYSNYSYSYFPIDEMANATIQTYEIAGSDKKEIKRANKHIYNMYCERFLNDAITNRQVNISKNNNHRKLTQVICVSFIITVLTFAVGVGIDYYECKFIDTNTTYIIIDGGEINVGQ